MALLPSWVAANIIFWVGIVGFSLLVIAENAKPQQDDILTTTVDGKPVCLYPKDNTPTLAAVAVGFMFACAVFANVFSGVPFVFATFNVFVPFHRSLVYLWYFICWASTITSIVIASYAAWQEATHHRNASQNILTAVNQNTGGPLCPTVKMGIFGGMGFVMIAATVQWTAFYVMSVTARFVLAEEEKGADMNGAYVGAQAGTPME